MLKLSVVNVDQLMDTFTRLEMSISETVLENTMLGMKLDDARRLLQFSVIKERCLTEERDSVLATQQTRLQAIQQQYNLREVIENLRGKVAELKRQNERAAEDKEAEVRRLTAAMTAAQERHQRALETLQLRCQREVEDAQIQLEARNAEVEKLLGRKDVEVEEMRKKLNDQERQKQSEILQLNLEFSAKLANVQNSAQRSQQNPNQSSHLHYNSQSHFKRKLQSFQEEKNREIETLRQRIKYLEERARRGDGGTMIQSKRRKT